MKTLPLLSPSVPFRGINSTNDPAFIGTGFWQTATNVRASNGCVQARGGQTVSKATTGLPSGVYQGSLETIDGSFLAWSASGTTKIYKWVTNTWVEVTGTTGTTTRFTGAVPITFAVVRDAMLSASAPFNLPGQRYLVAQSGVSGDYPRVMKTSLSGADSMKIHAPIGYGGISAYHARVYYSDYHTIASTGTARTVNPIVSVTNSGGANHFLGTQTNPGKSDQYVAVAVGTATAAADTITIRFRGGAPSPDDNSVNWSTVKELHILFSSDTPDIWNSLLIEAAVAGPGTYVTLYDSTSTSYASPALIVSGDNYLAGFKLPAVASGAYEYFRLTYQNQGAPATAQSFNIYGIFASAGTVPGGTEFSVGYMDSASRSEGPAVVCADDGPINAAVYGGSQISGMQIPVSPALGYEYQIFDGSYNSTGTPDYKNIYAKLPEGSEFLYLSSSSSLSSATVVTSYVPYLLPAPTGLHVPIPVATVMASIGARLWCGNVRSPYNAASTSDAWFSSLDTPFRFKSILEFTNGVPDIRGAATVAMQGEVVQAITPIAGGAIGSEGCYIFTDQNIYQVGGSDSFQLTRPGRRASFGTNSPNSIAVYAGLIMFMDTERQVRFLDSSLATISRDFVEDKLLGIPAAYIGNVAAGIWHEKYYLAFTPSGGTTNTNVLVYDLRRNVWTEDTVSDPVVKFCPFLVSGERQNLAFLAGGRQVQYDLTGATELGSDVTITLKSSEISDGLWNPIVLKNIGLVAAKVSGKTLTCKRYTKVDGTAPTAGTISLSSDSLREASSAENLVWRFDQDSVDNTVPMRIDLAASVELTGAVPCGTKLYSIVVETESVSSSGADRP